MKSTEIVPAVQDESLVVRDMLGTERTYSLTQIAERLVSKPVPAVDIARFALLCKMTGANPFAGEANLLPFYDGKTKGFTGQPYLTLAYFWRKAMESGMYDGHKTYLCDEDEKRLPATCDYDDVAGAICELYIKDQRLPFRVIITLQEALSHVKKLEYAPFWKNPHRAKHQLQVRAEYRALRKAFPPTPNPVVVVTAEDRQTLEQASEDYDERDADVIDLVPEEPEVEPVAPVTEDETSSEQPVQPPEKFPPPLPPEPPSSEALPPGHEWAEDVPVAPPGEEEPPIPLSSEIVMFATEHGLGTLATELCRGWAGKSDEQKRSIHADIVGRVAKQEATEGGSKDV